jgi:phenylacetyl-CoA:acceptor oxidoreductase subunit 1
MTRYVMVADLDRCVGCQTCTAACRQTNATQPGVQWRKVLDLEFGEYPDVQRVFVPVGCQHCADPPCMHVCPSTATRRRDDGIVTIDNDLCIGCAYCAVACPYLARSKVDKPVYAHGSEPTILERLQFDEKRLGVSQKCTFCADRIDAGLARGLTPGVDADATPACVNSCIAEALHFGDIEDPESNVSRMLAEKNQFRMHEELGTNPGFYYLWNNREKNDVAPNLRFGITHQQNWDWRAAGNFMFGGTGASLMFTTAVASFPNSPPDVLGMVSLLIVAAGLALVWLEIGRPWRFLNVYFNLKTSWMAREAVAAVILFALALAGVGWHQPILIGLAGLAGLAFLYCQTMMLRASKGIPAWRLPAISPLVISTGLSEGVALYLLIFSLAAAVPDWLSYLLLALIVLRAYTSWNYQAKLAGANAAKATWDAVTGMHRNMLMFGVVLPAILMLAAWGAPGAALLLNSIAAALVLLSGWYLKFILVTRVAYLQGFALGQPRRQAAS